MLFRLPRPKGIYRIKGSRRNCTDQAEIQAFSGQAEHSNECGVRPPSQLDQRYQVAR